MSDDSDNRAARPESGASQDSARDFLQRVVLVDGIGIIFLLTLAAIWFAADVLLLIFSCILFAVFLYELSTMVQARLHVSRRLALGLVVFVLLGLLGLGAWLMAPQLYEQARRLAALVPDSIEELRAALGRLKVVGGIFVQLPSTAQLREQIAALAPNAGLFFTGVLGAAGNVLIIVFVGIYFALQPTLYVEGMVTLVPQRKRPRAREVLGEIGDTLAKWLVGKACSMLVVGIAVSAGLAVLGVPLALILGIIAGLLDFIPYLGPLMAGVPAVLIAFTVSPVLALYTVLLLAVVQMAEGYLLTPLIDAKTVSLPPALTIVMQLLFGALFGLPGVAVATPLTAVLAVLVSTLYVQDVLGDRAKPPARP